MRGRVLHPAHPGSRLRAFYAGRDESGTAAEGWVAADLELGTVSYAVVDGGHALVYDTHTSPAHGEWIRESLEAEGVRELTVLLSHWHLDHVAGTAAFADCEIVATRRTAEHLARRRARIEGGELWGPPAVAPLILPTRTFEDELTLRIGAVEARAIAANVHTDDAAVLWLPGAATLLAGDTVEDTVTYVDEPQDLETHLAELGRLRALEPARVLPAHGDPGRIAAGGYGPELIEATRAYITALLRSRTDERVGRMPLRELIAEALAAGAVCMHEPYEEVHRHNLARVGAA